jgi:hypothetical protein
MPKAVEVKEAPVNHEPKPSLVRNPIFNTRGNASAHNSRRRSLDRVWAGNIPRHIPL